MTSAKVYVEVSVSFDANGQMYPRTITWKDGHVYDIDRVKDVRPAHAAKAGGQGDRYTVIVKGQERYLFFEHNSDFGDHNLGRWFVEGKG